MRYFFFGTLMDVDLLAVVLGRRVPREQLRPARLDGYRRRRARGESYPFLIADREASVMGLLVEGLSNGDAARIAFFEGDEYSLADCQVTTADGDLVEARAYLAACPSGAETLDWSFETFQAADKADAVVLCAVWMSFFGSGDLAAAEEAWARTRAELAASRRARIASGGRSAG